jgi:hypothetical protein
MSDFEQRFRNQLPQLSINLAMDYVDEIREENQKLRQKIMDLNGIPATTRYLSVAQAAAAWGRSRATVSQWCQRKLIPGVVNIGRAYAIPSDATPPQLARGRAAQKAK